MRVAVVTGEYPTAASPEKALFVQDQVAALRTVGHAVSVVHHDPPTLRRQVSRFRRLLGGVREVRGTADPTPPVSPARATEAPATRPARHPWHTSARLAHDSLGRAWAVRRMLLDLRRLDPPPQIVHAHNVFPAGVAAAVFSTRTRIPFVVTEHSSAYLRRQLSRIELEQAERVLGTAAAVVAVSPRQAEALPTSDALVVPNVVPQEFGLRHPSAAADGDIVSIGVLMPHKGMDVLLDAYAALPEPVRRKHRLVVIGDGPAMPFLCSRATGLGVADRIEFCGHLPRAGVAERLRRAALVVSASPVETFGMTLLEGLAAGVPFVAVRSGGPESIWFPGAGALVARSAADDLTDGLRATLTPEAQRGDAARRNTVLARFGAEVVAERLTEIYREATR